MSKSGCPYDNAKAESFFKTLKKEKVYLNQYQNFAEAQGNIGAFLEDIYNVYKELMGGSAFIMAPNEPDFPSPLLGKEGRSAVASA